MSDEIPTESPLQQRCRVVADALGIVPAAESEPLEAIIEGIRQAQIDPPTAIFVLYQAALARLPARQEILEFIKYFESDRAADISRRFTSSDEFRVGCQNRIRFERLPPGALAVDVTHTAHYPYNSGIQRVVRSTARRLRDSGASHVLIQYNYRIEQFQVITAAEAANVYDWERMQCRDEASPVQASGKRPKPPWKTKLKRFIKERVKTPVKHFFSASLKPRLKNFLGERFNASIRAFRQTWKSYQRVPSTTTASTPSRRVETVSKESEVRALFLWNDNLLLPELVDESRIEKTFCLLSYAPLTSTLVIYDLIPLKYPEFCVGILDGFVRYLSLLRLVDRVSCISEAIADDLREALPIFGRRLPGPVIASHRLGADFDFSDRGEVEKRSETSQDAAPVVLSVGTIEIRKNHWRILRALVRAQRQGCRFRAIFAGNPGWLNSSFVAELRHWQEFGFDVEVRTSVSESELSELYRSASLTVYCSYAEGFGLPIVESVSKGVPCVTSDRGCMKEVAEQIGGCVLVNPESETDIADAVIELFQHPTKLARLKAEAAQATWPTWADYAEELRRFATVEAVEQALQENDIAA